MVHFSQYDTHWIAIDGHSQPPLHCCLSTAESSASCLHWIYWVWPAMVNRFFIIANRFRRRSASAPLAPETFHSRELFIIVLRAIAVLLLLLVVVKKRRRSWKEIKKNTRNSERAINISWRSEEENFARRRRSAQINRKHQTLIRRNNFLNLINWIQLFTADAFECQDLRAEAAEGKVIAIWGVDEGKCKAVKRELKWWRKCVAGPESSGMDGHVEQKSCWSAGDGLG